MYVADIVKTLQNLLYVAYSWRVKAIAFGESMLFFVYSFLFGGVLWDPFWSLLTNSRACGLTFEGLGLTLDAHGVTLWAFELQFSSPWGHLRVILAPIGSIWVALGEPKSYKMHQAW